MITYEGALNIIQESCDSLHRGGLIQNNIKINEQTHILGGESIFDSIGFVTLFAEIEDSIIEKTNLDTFLILDDISEFNIDSPFLTAGVIASYIVEITQNID